MGDDILGALEERVGKLLDVVSELRKEKQEWGKEKQEWDKERAAIKPKIEGILERIDKAIGKED